MGKEHQTDSLGAWGVAVLAWLFPGGGHLSQGKLLRGILAAACVWLLILCGVLLGGHFYGLFDNSEGLLSNVFGFCNLGGGLIYVAARWFGLAVEDHARLATAEYGNVFLMVAGLINYLLALDAFDLKIGRKH